MALLQGCVSGKGWLKGWARFALSSGDRYLAHPGGWTDRSVLLDTLVITHAYRLLNCCIDRPDHQTVSDE